MQEGASAFLTRQFKTLAAFAVLALVLLSLLPADTRRLRIGRSVFFVVGAGFSAFIAYAGMGLATRANVRVAAAAREADGAATAMRIAFRTGGVVGFLTVGLGLLGAATVVLIYKGDAPTVLEGFGFGAALLAMFIRVGGGIFTKAADVGADLVGKVEQGIPEDDPRNAATIADNVGDNVGDCAGMAADLFESYAVTLVAALILGKAAFGEEGLVFPLIVPAHRRRSPRSSASSSPSCGRPTAAACRPSTGPSSSRPRISAVLCAIAAFVYLPRGCPTWPPVPDGIVDDAGDRRPAPDRDRRRGHRHRCSPSVIQLLTGYFTETQQAPGPGHRRAPRSPARPPSSCPASRSASSRRSTPRCSSAPPSSAPTCSVAARSSSACSASRWPAPACSPRSASSSRWTPSARSRTTRRASPRCPATSTRRARAVLTDLDAVGNTTKAITKGIAISTAVLAATALFGSFTDASRPRSSTPAPTLDATSATCSTPACSTSPTRRTWSA